MARSRDILADGDRTFIGVNERMDPGQLPEGMLARAINQRFRQREVQPRKGVHKPAWLNRVRPSVTGDRVQAWPQLHGGGVFRDPNGTELVLLAADAGIQFSRQQNVARAVPMPAAVAIQYPVQFTQAFHKMILWRGETMQPLVMETVDEGFDYLVEHWAAATTYASGAEVAHGPWSAVNSVTRSGSTVTVTTANDHGWLNGQEITLEGANEADYNGTFSITVTGGATFTYEVGNATPASPATGTVQASAMTDYWSPVAGNLPVAGESPTSTPAKWTALTNVMPNAARGVFVQNRVIAPTRFDASTGAYGGKQDFLAASDVLDLKHTYFDQNFRINLGGDDELVDALVYDDNRVILFKEKSVYLLAGFVVGDNATLGQNVSLSVLLPNYGLAAPGAAVMVGSDVYFWASRQGVVSLYQTEQNKVQGVDLPVSEPLQPVVDRVDHRYEHLIRLAYWDNKLYVALPLNDGSNGNNAIAVYDFLNKQWSGYDEGEAVCPKEFFTATYNGSQRLFYLGTDGYVNMVEELDGEEEVADAASASGLKRVPVVTTARMRGYHHDDLSSRFFRTAHLAIKTRDPRYTVKLIADGVGEERVLVAGRVKDPVKYYRPFDAPDWNDTNVNDDHATAYRQDYSVSVDNTAGRLLKEGGGVLLQEGGGALGAEGMTRGTNLGTQGLVLDRHQQTQESFNLGTARGRYGMIEVKNERGELRIVQAALTTAPGPKAIEVVA